MSRYQPIEPRTSTLPEQRAVHCYRTEARTEEDSEDGVYDVRVPTSVRRYHTPITLEPVNLVVHDRRKTHQQAPRRPQQQARTTQQQVRAPQAPEKPRFHVLVYLGAGMLVMCALWIAGSALVGWWQLQQDDQHYGRPRTYQTDARVGHNDEKTPSHFIALNLHRHVVILEFPGSDLTKEAVYLGPELFGDGQELAPVTLTFKDVNGDGKPDMIATVQNSTAIFINEGGKFRPATPEDHTHL